ncbi:DUF4255 domain-containing protein [Leptolyngbya cf. ectocarpi LEGE 11479]|uniref:DUF4255 domain-containing protein n=1 Tax=Leptolyngbya cf. ectocarpi LEGE 11479 TaxID=1828722 RepID=A0A928ZSX6_LEPEC|nr:DUF4255 domain-containing protein [Leptolyngbya ectocarpi]MBE9067002.1 DUF4255 domain-containing protein [Leptolyngbya cf. ectocarpi LEGE 11479]
MSNHLAIATVTATLQRLLQGAIQRDVDGARVTTLKPNSIGSSTPESGINMFLYQVAHNSALRNSDTAAFRSKKGPIRRQSSLDLYYMLSAYGNDTELEPQRLLGSIVRLLSDNTVLTTDMIDAAVGDAAFLAESDLTHHPHQITINPVDMDTDELSKIWSTFFQAPYSLSLVYKVMAVVIDGQLSAQHALPVRESSLAISPFAYQPIVTKVLAQAGPRFPIEANTILRVVGKQLEGPRTKIKIGSTEVVPQCITDTEIILSLGDVPAQALQAGIQPLQVIHYPSQQPAVPVSSNACPFVLCPTVTSVQVSDIEGIDDDPRTGRLQVSTHLRVKPSQRVVIALNEWSIEIPAIYLFEAPLRTMDTDCLTIPINNVKPGEYLIRLQVDGADSQLDVDSDPKSKTFNWFNSPRVVIT